MLEKLSTNGADNPLNAIITEEEGSWISALVSFGAAIGPFIFGNLANKIGRKYTLLAIGIPVLIGYLLMSFSKSLTFFYIARLLCGLSAGGACNIVPVYTAEIASSYNRGALSSLFNVFVCAGMLFSYCVGPFVNVKAFNLTLAVFPLIFIVLFFILGCETPFFYSQKGEHDLAQQSLQKIRGTKDVEEELSTIRKQIMDAGHGNFVDIFKSKPLTRAFIIPVGLMVFQQLSGILAVFNYAQTIFKQAGVAISPALCSIIIGIVQMIASFVTPLVIERLGRKVLLQISAIGMLLSQGPLGTYCYLKDHNYDVSSIAILPIICLMVFIAAYNVGYGPLPWSLMGELFPTNVKCSASLFITFFSWAMAFIVAKYFQSIASAVGMGVAFWIFAIGCGISVPFTHLVVIETKGKSFRQIQKELEI